MGFFLEKLIFEFFLSKPYVPTSPDELEDAKNQLKEKNLLLSKTNDIKELRKVNCLSASWAGGEDGNEVTYRILEQAKVYNSYHGLLAMK